LKNKIQDFYTPGGIHVYFKDKLANDEIDVEDIVAKVEERIPEHLLTEVEMIIIGWFQEFEDREINAFYKDGTLCISNLQDDSQDMYDDIIHEISHSIEIPYGYQIYGDNKIRDEFLRKRKYLHDILWQLGYKAPLAFFQNIEYDQEFDMFLYQTIGYDKLMNLVQGLFISPYAATSLREYFATGFTDFYMDPNHKFLQKISPALYQKLITLQAQEKA
jgi:hypothetical protein|tara:strand:- start:1367 stop:2020 length:654 start_codon:yes stop_codon:yes gene_type:complete